MNFLIIGLPLIRLVRSPDEVLSDDSYKINSTYYITKVIIPPLNRCFLLLGVDVREWFAELPRKQQFVAFMTNVLADGKKGTISQYFSTTSCVIECGNQCINGVCSACRSKPQRTVTILADKIFHLERKRFQTQKVIIGLFFNVHLRFYSNFPHKGFKKLLKSENQKAFKCPWS